MKYKYIFLTFLILILLMSITSCKYECDKCHDKGVVTCVICNGKGQSKCNVCEGKEKSICNECGGSGIKIITTMNNVKLKSQCGSFDNGYEKCLNCDNGGECTICNNGYVRCYYCQGKQYKDEA